MQLVNHKDDQLHTKPLAVFRMRQAVQGHLWKELNYTEAVEFHKLGKNHKVEAQLINHNDDQLYPPP